VKAWLLAEKQDHENAIQTFKKAKELKEEPWIDYNIACILANQGKFEETVQILEGLNNHRNIIKYASNDPDFKDLKQESAYHSRLKAIGMLQS